MEQIIAVLKEIETINNAYEISNEAIEKLWIEMNDAKVCTPIIGKFSSGKSALVNTLLGYSSKILREDITPETAVPAEIVYSDTEEVVTIVRNDGTYENISVDEYRTFKADATTVKCARVQLRNSFLEEIPDVMLVDMPGFESGFEIHNKAIDNYLPQSLAYIVTFPADDMIVRSSVGNILKELCLHDMPLCVVITKYDKKNDEFEETLSKLKESLKRFIGDRQIHYCLTCSFTGDAEELEEFLKDIQEKSQIILANKYRKMVCAILENTENYLVTTLTNSQLSESELDEQEEKLQKQLSGLDSKFSKEKGDFDLEISECIEEIKHDVQMAMESEESTFVAMAMNNQSINEYLNNTVRSAVTISVKKRLIPKLEKYLKRVNNCVNSESIGDVHISFSFDPEKMSKGIAAPIIAGVSGVIIGLPILGILAGIITGILMKRNRDKKREEEKQQIRGKLQGEVFPQVLREVGHNIETTVMKQVTLVNTSIEEDIKMQRDTLEKAMSDVRSKLDEEKERKETLAIDIRNNLDRIEEMKEELKYVEEM